MVIICSSSLLGTDVPRNFLGLSQVPLFIFFQTNMHHDNRIFIHTYTALAFLCVFLKQNNSS